MNASKSSSIDLARSASLDWRAASTSADGPLLHVKFFPTPGSAASIAAPRPPRPRPRPGLSLRHI